MVDGGMGSWGCTVVRWGCVVRSSVLGSGMVRGRVGWGSMIRGRMGWGSMIRGRMGWHGGMVSNRVGRSLSMGGIMCGARAVVGLARVGDVSDVARVRVVHMVGHGLFGNSTHFVVIINIREHKF